MTGASNIIKIPAASYCRPKNHGANGFATAIIPNIIGTAIAVIKSKELYKLSRIPLTSPLENLLAICGNITCPEAVATAKTTLMI